MNHVSFVWTTEALIAGAKEETRRHWTAAYAKRFHAGDIVVAIDKDFRYGGKRVGLVVITADPYPENTRDMPCDAYKREGLLWMEEHGQRIRKQHPMAFFKAWRAAAEDVYVVRFKWLGTIQDIACGRSHFGEMGAIAFYLAGQKVCEYVLKNTDPKKDADTREVIIRLKNAYEIEALFHVAKMASDMLSPIIEKRKEILAKPT